MSFNRLEESLNYIKNLSHVTPAQVNSSPLIPHLNALSDAERQTLRSAIRYKAPSLKPHGDFFYKSLTAEPYRCSYYSFIKELILGKKFPKRIGDQNNVTTTGMGVYLRDPDVDSKYPFKTPQYSAQEKEGFTNFQSTSISMEDFFSKVFSFDKNRRLIAGPMFEKNSVLLSERLFLYTGGTVTRSYDAANISIGEEYFKEHHQKNLFSKSEFEAYKKMVRKNPDKYSEPLVRIKWLLSNPCKYFIGSDNLDSRLLAKQYADSFLLELKKENLCPPNYFIQVCYYIPERNELLFKEYTQEEHQLDKYEANRIASDPDLKSFHYQNKQFEFLLGLGPNTIQECLSEAFNGIPLAIYLLKNGYEHIYRFLIEKAAFDLKAMLDGLAKGAIYAKEILPHAVRSGDLSLVNTLLQYDLNMNADDYSKQVTTALEKYLPEIAIALISSKHFNQIQTRDINQALVLAACLNDEALVQLLLDHGANINSKRVHGRNETPLMLAAYYGHTRIVELLLARGAETEIKNSKGHTALAIATYRGHLQTVEQLLSHQAHVNTVDNNGSSPLLLALYVGHKNIMSSLLDYKADVNQANFKGKTALHIAASDNNKTDIIAALLEHHAEIDAQNTIGLTPLMLAIQLDKTDAAQMLITNGADLEIKNIDNETALDIAYQKNQTTMINFIKRYTDIKKLQQETAILSDENELVASQLSRLFNAYASSIFNLRDHKQLASKISIELEKHHDWTLPDCKKYIDAQLKNCEIKETDTFACLLNLIKTLEAKMLKQQEEDAHSLHPPSLIQDNFQTDVKASTSIHGFLGKNWASIYTNELYELLYDLSKPYIRITHADIDKIKILVNKGAVLNQPIHGKTIAEWALDVHTNSWFAKDWECVKAIIEARPVMLEKVGTQPHLDDKQNSNKIENFFLQKAVLYGQHNMVDYLLQRGADFKNDYVTSAESKDDKTMLNILNKYNPNVFQQLEKSDQKNNEIKNNNVNKVSFWSFLKNSCISDPDAAIENDERQKFIMI